MKKPILLLISTLALVATAGAQTTVVEETFTYADGDVSAVGIGGTGWDATEAGWQVGNSNATRRFIVSSGEALYQGGGSGTNTEQNRTFASAQTSNTAETIAVNFTLLYNEDFPGRGIGIYLTNGGINQFFIGKRVNSSVGLHSNMNGGSTLDSFSNTGAAEPITATITYNGTDTSIVLSDSDETLAAHTFAGTFTFDGISLAAYNGATTTNGIDDILVTTTTNPDPWLQVDSLVELTNNGAATPYSIPIFNAGAEQSLNISDVDVVAIFGTLSEITNLSFPSTLAPLTSGSIDFTFTPSSGPNLYTFDFDIYSDDASDTSPRTVSVDIDVIEPLIEVDVTSIDFGAFANNPGLQTAEVMVTNNGGSQALTINSTDISGSSAFTVTSAPASIAAGATMPIEITFDPGTQPGTFSGTLTIGSDDYYNTEPTITLSASTAFFGDPLAEYTFGAAAAALDLSSSDPSVTSTASDLTEVDGGAFTEFGQRVYNGNPASATAVEGNAIGWSRRDKPNNGLDLTTTAPTDSLSFTLTPGTGVTIDLSTHGWLTLDLATIASIGGTTAYDFVLGVDDGSSPFVIGPITGLSQAGTGTSQVSLTFDVRSLGSVTSPVTFTLMPQRGTGDSGNGVLSQAGGYLDNVVLSGEEILPAYPVLVVTSPAVLSDEGLGGPFSIPFQNRGGVDLNISSVTTDGSGDFATISGITYSAPVASLAAGTIDFTFAPDAGPGLYQTNLTVVSNDPASPTTVALEITVRDPEILVTESTVSFGPLPNNPGVQTLNLAVTNDGEDEPLVISGTTHSGASEFTVTALPGPIAPGATGDIEITFTPGATVGRLNASITIQSNDFDGTEPTVALTGFVDPSGTVVSRFDFDPNQASAAIVDVDGSSMINWTTGDLTDMATGTGASSSSNQGGNNRNIVTGVSGNYLRFSSNREGDAQTPLLPGGNNESTWTTFTITPDTGGGAINFIGGTAVIDTYANTSLNSNTAADWTLYYLLDGASAWATLGTSAGASTSSGVSAPLSLTWDLTPIGNQTAPVQFLLDPVSTGGTNGIASQRGTGFDNLILTAGSITPGTGFESWASGFGIPNDPDYDGTDNDGIPALVEYALDNLSPLVPEGSPAVLQPGNLLAFTKGAEAVTNGDVTYAIETSSDLGITDPWTAVDPGDLEEGTATDPSTISYTLPAGQGKIFARLAVTKVP